MRKYKIKVADKIYEVEVEEIENSVTPNPPQIIEPSSPAKIGTKAQIPSIKTVTAPIPGKIMKISVIRGTKVVSGTPLFVIEAMKMENDILADTEATIAEVLVKEGDMVQTGQVLLKYE